MTHVESNLRKSRPVLVFSKLALLEISTSLQNFLENVRSPGKSSL
jgi:hypothetical protein